MTTDAAFAVLVNSDQFWPRTGLSARTRAKYIDRLKNNQKVKEQKKIDLLLKSGFIIEREASYEFPSEPAEQM